MGKNPGKNLVRQRTYKERAQPSARKHLGLLEKHKDYVERAKDFHKKEDKIRALKEKAFFKNPDEFYYKMKSLKTKDGVHVDESKQKNILTSVIKKLKTQDVTSLHMRKTVEGKKVARLEASLHQLSGEGSKNKHTLFLDSEESVKGFDAADHFQTAPELAGRAFNRPRLATLETEKVQVPADLEALGSKKRKKWMAKAEDKRERQYKELQTRQKRQQKATKAIQKQELHKALMGKGRRSKVKGADGETVFKWKRQRKR